MDGPMERRGAIGQNARPIEKEIFSFKGKDGKTWICLKILTSNDGVLANIQPKTIQFRTYIRLSCCVLCPLKTVQYDVGYKKMVISDFQILLSEDL